ncbi:MAG TPA: citrate synthase [Haliangiales bacterium]|nr:citrate synthase [Haliangiales bacterium]
MDQHDGRAWISAAEAAGLLGIRRATLYAYVSRGLVRSVPAVDGRSRRYLRADLDTLRARRDAHAGHGAAAAGAMRWGEPVLESALTHITAAGPRYRGRPALALARDASYEAVAELLWTGALPALPPRWIAGGQGVPARRLAALLPAAARPLDAMILTLAALEVAVPSRGDATEDAAVARGRVLCRRLAASVALPGRADRLPAALAADTVAESVLVAFGARVTAARVRAVQAALILVADHELNPSSFAARIPASVGADLLAAVGAAIQALSGPLHGAAADFVEAMLSEARGPEGALRVVRQRLRRGEMIPGFGHRLYPGGDPRAAPLLAHAEALAPGSRVVRSVRAFVDAMALASQEHPTVDLGLCALAGALGLPAGGAVALFAAGRAAGWIAHALEQRRAGFALRPRARYVGEDERSLATAGSASSTAGALTS